MNDARSQDRARLAAKTLTWTEGGAAGAAIVAMFQGLGIEDQLSEIQTVKGVQVLGLFPQAYQKPVIMTAGIAAQSKDATSAQALVKFLTSAKAAPAVKAAGMKPAAQN